MGHAKLCRQGWQGGQWLYSYFVAVSPAVMVTAVTSIEKSHCRQTTRLLLKAFLTVDGSKVNQKPNLVTSIWSQGGLLTRAEMP